MQKFEVLSKEQLEKIHEASLDIMEKTGVEFHYQPALDAFKKAGAKVDGHKVYLTRQLVEENLKKAPSQFTLYARNPEKNIIIGGDNIVFTPCYGAPFITDLDHGRRQGTMEDFNNLAKLSAASPNMDLTGGILIEPNDIPDHKRHGEMIYSCIKNSDKCFMGSSYGEESAVDSVKMASLLFGPETNLAEKPAMITLINSLTPLAFDERMLGALMEYNRTGQAVIITALGIAGATSPGTLAGTLVCQNAEVLAGIVLAQIVNPGCPVVYGSASSIAEMSTGALSIGTPEMALMANASAQLARSYNLPVRGGGSVSDTKCADAQGAYEAMMNLYNAMASGINFVLHSAGIIDSYNTVSYEKLMIDDEICGMVKRVKRGFDVNEDTLAVDVLQQVGPGGHFLDQDHTFEHFRTEFYRPSLSNRTTFDAWIANGSQDITKVANAKFKEVLANYQAPELSQDIDKQLRKFVDEIK